MKNYYFVAASLPTLQIGVPPEIEFSEFEHLLKDNLTPKDLAKTSALRSIYDIENFRAFWKGEELDPRGNLNANDLGEALLAIEGLPDYMYNFLTTYEDTQDRLDHFPALVEAFFREESKRTEGFLKEYLTFERELRLVLSGFRAKRLGLDIAQELQYEDTDDDIVAQILAQKDSKTYEPPEKYEDLKALFEEHYDAPLELYKALCEYRFEKINEILGVDTFSINYILGYMVQLIMVENWMQLDKKKGSEIVSKILKEKL